MSCHFEVDSSLHSDAGQYKVTLENKLGAASATINVKVIGTVPIQQVYTLVLNLRHLLFFNEKHYFSYCVQVFLAHARKLWPLRSQRAPARCPGILQTLMAAALSSTTCCRSVSCVSPFGHAFGEVSLDHKQKLNVPLCIDVHVQRREAGRRTYVNMMSGENKVSWNVKDLIPNGEYYFRVQAVNKIGGGEFIELRNPVIAEDQKRTIFGIIAITLVNEHYRDIFL